MFVIKFVLNNKSNLNFRIIGLSDVEKIADINLSAIAILNLFLSVYKRLNLP